MLRLSSVIFAALLICGATFAHSESSSAVDFAQHAAGRALNFKQGDVSSGPSTRRYSGALPFFLLFKRIQSTRRSALGT
jgi:hypothetical protein